jgi:hypothetical protein
MSKTMGMHVLMIATKDTFIHESLPITIWTPRKIRFFSIIFTSSSGLRWAAVPLIEFPICQHRAIGKHQGTAMHDGEQLSDLP